MGNKSTAIATGQGTVWITVSTLNRFVKCEIQNVLYVPELSYQLFSVAFIDCKGLKTPFHNGMCKIYKKEQVVAEQKLFNGLYFLNIVTSECKANNIEHRMISNLDLWHQRLAHVQGWKHWSNYGKSSRAPIPKHKSIRSEKC